MQTMSAIQQDNRPHFISMPNIGKRTIQKETDTVCAQLHFNICKETGVKLDNEHWYDRVPKLVKTSLQGKVTTL